MNDRHYTKKAAILEKIALSLKAQPTTLRRCLGCDDWMHSTGADHRVCNCCKGEADYESSLVGKRVTVRGRRKGVAVESA